MIHVHRRNNRGDRGGWSPPTFRLWTSFCPWESLLMSEEATRIQDLTSEFSKKSRAIPWTPTAGGTLAHLPLPGLRCWDPSLGPLNFSAVVAPLLLCVLYGDRRYNWTPTSCYMYERGTSYKRINESFDDVLSCNIMLSTQTCRPVLGLITRC